MKRTTTGDPREQEEVALPWWSVLSRSVMSDSLWPHGPPASSIRGASPGKTTGVGCHAFLQEIFPNPGRERYKDEESKATGLDWEQLSNWPLFT